MAKKKMMKRAVAKKTVSKKKTTARAKRPATRRASPIPKGLHTVTANLVLQDTAKAIEFYKQAFGAKEITRMPGPDGRGIMHAQVKIGDSSIFMNDEQPQSTLRAPSADHKATASIQIYVPSCDTFYARALKAGAKEVMPMMDMFWGDRMGMLMDPFGNTWAIATHMRDLTESQMRKAAEAFARNMPQQQTIQTQPNA